MTNSFCATSSYIHIKFIGCQCNLVWLTTQWKRNFSEHIVNCDHRYRESRTRSIRCIAWSRDFHIVNVGPFFLMTFAKFRLELTIASGDQKVLLKFSISQSAERMGFSIGLCQCGSCKKSRYERVS